MSPVNITNEAFELLLTDGLDVFPCFDNDTIDGNRCPPPLNGSDWHQRNNFTFCQSDCVDTFRQIDDFGLHLIQRIHDHFIDNKTVTIQSASADRGMYIELTSFVNEDVEEYIFPSDVSSLDGDNITLPRQVLPSGNGYLINVKYSKPDVAMERANISGVNRSLRSVILSSTVHPRPVFPLPGSAPVILAFKNHDLINASADYVSCEFLEYGGPDGQTMSWNSAGCHVNSTSQSATVCHCDHLTSFGVLVRLREFETACIAVAALLHYFFTSVFCWMLVEGIQIYLQLVKVFNAAERRRYVAYYLIGWGVPLVLVGISLGFGHNQYVADDKSSLKAAVVLLPLLGMTWLFGLLSVSRHTLFFEYIFAILNSLQGFFIFVFYCLSSKEVHSQLARKKMTFLMGREQSWRDNVTFCQANCDDTLRKIEAFGLHIIQTIHDRYIDNETVKVRLASNDLDMKGVSMELISFVREDIEEYIFPTDASSLDGDNITLPRQVLPTGKLCRGILQDVTSTALVRQQRSVTATILLVLVYLSA
ncbi:adhesion G-protein coupled receptor G2-like [Ptychodera flava]|uniref:adhesion G-protein coupled receptor G2-like n=1 Tax=Ptychodera flava TaxID=63121 RepID=UPI00396A27CE